MTLHPLFKTLATRPELLAEHAGAYVELASAEVFEAAERVLARATLMVGAVACGALGISLAGTAVMLAAVMPLQDMPAPWALALAPALPLAAAVVLWWAQRRHTLDLSFELLREQLALDRALMQQVAER
jgi:uncharacterized membrane protein YqjE